MGIKFNVKVNVKKKYIVDGKEYDSIEAMPEAIRTAYEAALEARHGKALSAESTEQQEAKEIANEEEQVKAMATKAIEPTQASKGSRLFIVLAAGVLLLIILYFLMRRGGP